jgi:hypothetical protein
MENIFSLFQYKVLSTAKANSLEKAEKASGIPALINLKLLFLNLLFSKMVGQ